MFALEVVFDLGVLAGRYTVTCRGYAFGPIHRSLEALFIFSPFLARNRTRHEPISTPRANEYTGGQTMASEKSPPDPPVEQGTDKEKRDERLSRLERRLDTSHSDLQNTIPLLLVEKFPESATRPAERGGYAEASAGAIAEDVVGSGGS